MTHEGSPAFLEALVQAALAPSLSFEEAGSERLIHFNRLRAQTLLEDGAFAGPLLRKVFADTWRRTLEAFQRALPHLSDAEITWRFHLLLGALVFTAIPSGRVHPMFEDAGYRPGNKGEAFRFLVPLIAAAFRANAVGETAAPPGEHG